MNAMSIGQGNAMPWTEQELREALKNKPALLEIAEAQLNAPQTHARRVLDLASSAAVTVIEHRGNAFVYPEAQAAAFSVIENALERKKIRSRKPRPPLTLEQLKYKFAQALNRLEISEVREKHHQRALVLWARIQAKENPKLWMLKYLHGDGAGDYRTVKVAREMVAQGAVKGYPDLTLLYPARGFHGLTIELKIEGGKESSEQKEWKAYLNSVGYLSVKLVGWESARDKILWYLEAS